MEKAKISIITACYNHGDVIDDAIQSVQAYSWSVPIEHIIINDGSTDKNTINKLSKLKQAGFTIVDQKNAGPANARNNGIAISTGDFIIPLDADNKLIPPVFEKALSVMEKDNDISVVYTNAKNFGGSDSIWKPGEIDTAKFLNGNYLDTCALIRKNDFITIGGYDDQIPFHGNEDWDLWLNFVLHDYRFYYLEEIGFQYRILENSLSRRESTPNQDRINAYITKKYANAYATYYRKLYAQAEKYQYLQSFIRTNKCRSIAKIILNKKIIEY